MINLYKIINNLFSLKKLDISSTELRLLDKNLNYSPEHLAIHIYNVQNEIIAFKGENNAKDILLILQYVQRIITQIEIYYSAKIGTNLKIVHGLGLVIGARVVIKDNVDIYQGVTIGDKASGDNLRPIIENNVKIYTGANVLGGCIIGENSIIGANSLVLKSFPPNSIIAGIPAKIIKKIK